MNKILVISAISLIAVVMIVSIVSPAIAAKDNNNGNNGCEKANPNGKACEKNPNTDVTCQDCVDKLIAAYELCGDDYACQVEATNVYQDCLDQVPIEEQTCVAPPPPGF